MTQNRYSVIQALASFERADMLQHIEMSDLIVMQRARNGWFSLFIPIITAFCFVPMICVKRDTRAIRYCIFRSSKFKFNLSVFFSGVFCGGFAVTLGYAIFCGAVYLLFPHMAEFDAALLPFSYSFHFFRSLLGVFLFAVFWSMPAMFLTSVLQNRYVIMCVPLFIKYGISQSVVKITQNAVSDLDNINYNLMRFVNIIDPDRLMFSENNVDVKWVVLVFGVFAFLFFCGYMLAEMTREDCGA